jgi:hypothetical protein
VSGSGSTYLNGPAHDAAAPRRARLLYVFLLLAAVAGAAVLFSFDPAAGGFYPPCLFHRCTGLHCPGCGSTRGLHALLHGRVWAAFRFNPLMVIVLPFLVPALARYTRRTFSPRPAAPARRAMPGWSIRALFVLIVAFWVLRNLPHRPFAWLAPTDVSARRPA